MAILQLGNHAQAVLGLECCANGCLHSLIRDEIETEALEDHGEHGLEFHHSNFSCQLYGQMLLLDYYC